ncbi:unnamed protein product [Ostreobium quekettii]|uniref:Uncharacterized protein n=1 Tax=Ostreobium quekettii TaxID=121088 RepID=A0A8S1IMZ6_9CHLO|nr:unnamed protein product [Ostreobium quekettii]|eukprot:evm.model.scf_311.4 EVM.evm.TU.scf_311.4   scf_311:73692-76076(-)
MAAVVEATALDVATALLQELSAVKGAAAWHRKLVSGVLQVQDTLRRIDGTQLSRVGMAKVVQARCLLNRALAIVEQHGAFESQFLHAQWEGEISTALRHLWKLHIELLLAAKLQEEVSRQVPPSSYGSDVEVLSSDTGSVDLDQESLDGC